MNRLRFGTAGIRGVFGKELNLNDMLPLCYAVSKVIGEGSYGVGFDTRKGCKTLAKLVEASMAWTGNEVMNFGLLPIPVFAFNIKRNRLKAGLMLTASHNPPEYVGIKLLDEEGKEPSPEIERKIEAELNFEPKAEKFGAIEEYEYGVDDYVEALLKTLPTTKRRLTILVDCANGAASNVTPKLLNLLGHRTISLHSHHSHLFSGRHPEPTHESLRESAELVRRYEADLGIAHDGDADRLVLINKDGRILPDYVLSYLMLKLILQKRRGNVIISINTSNAVESLAKEKGCKVFRTRLGKTAELLKREGGIFATEPSKVVDASWGYWEDGIYGALQIVQHLSYNEIGLEELMMDLPYYFNHQVNILVREASYEAIREAVLKRYQSYDLKEVQEVDGVRLIFQDDSWLLFRVSGTEPKVRVYVESKDEELGRKLVEDAVNLVRSVTSPA